MKTILASIGASLILTTVGIGVTTAIAAENATLSQSDEVTWIVRSRCGRTFLLPAFEILIQQSKFG